jgi:hypothetical protein
MPILKSKQKSEASYIKMINEVAKYYQKGDMNDIWHKLNEFDLVETEFQCNRIIEEMVTILRSKLRTARKLK